MSKKDIKRMGLPSPDIADSISLTFAGNVYIANTVKASKRLVRKTNFHWV